MSKVKKLVSKKISEHRVPSHYSSNSLINPSSTYSNLKPQIEKFEVPTESPYAQRISRIRSSSNLKESVNNQSSGFVSPPLNTKFASNLKSKITLNASFITKPNDPCVKIKKKNIVQRQSIDNQTYLIELKIDEIFNKHKESGISNEILDKYRECLEEIIYKDKIFGEVIAKIKFAYEDWITNKLNIIAEQAKIQNDLAECNKKLNDEIEENKRLHKKIQKFSRENVELGRSLEERDQNCRILQEHLLKITNISIEEVPQDRTSWKVLIAENKNYAELCTKLKKKIKTMKLQEKKLMKLFWTLKQKGVPIEDYYENMNSKKVKEQSFNNSIDDVSDNEPINIEPAKSKIKPSNVPMLKMNKVEPNSFSNERNSDSGDEEVFT